MKRLLAVLTLVLSGFGVVAPAGSAKTLHDFTVQGIDGSEMDLSRFKGKAVLLVNTASFCGFTNQYTDLQELHEAYADQGFVVLGVPSDSFDQEYGNDADVKEFCEVNYGITFPLTTRLDVTGDDAHPIYQWIKDEMGSRAEPGWNFHKFVIGPDGKPTAEFKTAVKPQSTELRSAIEAVLPSGDALASEKQGD